MKNYLKAYGYLFGIILLLTIILSIINYFTNKELYIFKILIPIISIFISSIILGKYSKKKAYLEGIKFSLIFILFSIIISYFIIHNSFNIKVLVYYLVILFSSIIGSMLGINIKKNK